VPRLRHAEGLTVEAHGGANEQVIKMLLEIGDPSKVSAFLDRAFAEKKKIMGFGHRVYKVQDPRSPLLKDMSRKVCEKTGNAKLFQMLEMIEARVTEAKKLPSNVDFYSATLLYCVGIPVDLFTPMFVMSRIAGYSAHYLEQVSDNRLLRPRANYTGAMDLPFVPLSER
jgi:citrate synthase